ncbi:MAG: DNA polymerase IV [Candidatus Omnitrophica bacterium]|nr:DNA polymerase IV [Candidatus Omnitrophota bacterium]
MPERIIAHMDMDAFFAAVEQRDNPALRGKPVIIGADPKGGQGRGVVATCSYEARKYNIHSALPISIAYRRCPQGIYLRGNHQKYREVSRQIFAVLKDYTPDIQPVSIDEAFMDLTGCLSDGRSPLDLCRAIKKDIRARVGLTASIGIAPNKMIAKIASDYNKPDGLLEIKPDQVRNFLWPLPIGKIWGVGKHTESALHQLQIKTVGELARTPIEALSKRFGTHGLHLHQLANGIDERPVAVDDEIKSVSNEHTFEQDTTDQEEIIDRLLYLSEKVSRRMRKHDLKGKTVTLKIRLKGFQTFSRAETLDHRTNFSDTIYTTALHLYKIFFRPGMHIRLIGVRVANFEDPYVRDSLFEDPAEKRDEDLHRACDQIKDKFGERAIRRGIYKTGN